MLRDIFSEVGDIHVMYVKRLKGPYCVASAYMDRMIQNDPTIVPIDEDIYHLGVEDYAGKCACGGAFTFEAPPRCPKCKSDNYEVMDGYMHYD